MSDKSSLFRGFCVLPTYSNEVIFPRTGDFKVTLQEERFLWEWCDNNKRLIRAKVIWALWYKPNSWNKRDAAFKAWKVLLATGRPFIPSLEMVCVICHVPQMVRDEGNLAVGLWGLKRALETKMEAKGAGLWIQKSLQF